MPQETYRTLHDLVTLLCTQSKAHICIHDVSGILKTDLLQLGFEYQVHSKDYCAAAKSTPKGFSLCMACKLLANQKAIEGRELFCGHCPFGLFEIAKPVVIDDKVQCIIYFGNLLYDKVQSEQRLTKACRLTNAPNEELIHLLSQTQPVSSPEAGIQACELIDSYIRLLYAQSRKAILKPQEQQHWAVQTIEQYIRLNYQQNVTLENLAKLYFINNKYIGRLFKKQTGETFHGYLGKVRLEHAAKALRQTEKSVLVIAMDCGFQNVTYFNRLFAKAYHMTPTVYRKKFDPNEM